MAAASSLCVNEKSYIGVMTCITGSDVCLLSNITSATISLHSVDVPVTYMSVVWGSSRSTCVMSSMGEALSMSLSATAAMSSSIDVTSGEQSVSLYLRSPFVPRRAGSINTMS